MTSITSSDQARCSDVVDVRCDDAAALLQQRKAREARERQERKEFTAAMDAQGAPVRARVQALQAQQRALFDSGQVDRGADSLSVMTYGANEARLGPASRRMEAWLGGRSEGYTFGGRPPEED
jgi:hypothetical protein